MQKGLITYTFEPISEQPYGAHSVKFNGVNIGHISIHNSLNANGADALVQPAVRQIFDFYHGDFGWHFYQIWNKHTPRVIEEMNELLDGILVGSGGFLLKDQWGADARGSGWQWNIMPEQLNQIKVPLCIFGIGYNRFRNQEEFEPNFVDHINQTVEKACFVGLRNTGSIRMVSNYLKNEDLKKKLTLQYCPTTVSYQIYPAFGQLSDTFEAGFRNRDKPVLAFNFAADRLEMRFPLGIEEGMKQCATAVKKLYDSGWEIIFVPHKQIDRQIEPYLDSAGIEYLTHDLTYASRENVLKFYTEVDLVTGMRGHSQLIPFGLRKPIVSIISHNKMRYLLEDIGHEEWGSDINEKYWVDDLVNKINLYGLKERKDTLIQLSSSQSNCWASSQKNMDFMISKFQEFKNSKM